jgi:integrase
MATIRKRRWRTARGEQKEAWRVSYTDVNGERWHKQFDLKRDADAYRVQVEGELANGIHIPDAASVTVSRAADIWIASCEAAGCDRGTLKTYREIVNRHIRPHLGNEKLSRVSSPRVIEFRDAMMATRSHAMASKAVRHLSMILAEAMRRGLVGKNAAREVKVKRPRGDKRQRLARRAEIPPIEHLRAMLEAANRLSNEDPRPAVVVRVVMLAGLRASEVRGLSWQHVDLKAPSLTIAQRADRWCEIGPPKSDAGHRTVPIGPSLATNLKAWKLRCRQSPLNLMFPNSRGGVIDQKSFIALFLKVQIAAGLAIDTGRQDAKGRVIWRPRYGWHDLRHVAASNWLNDGIDLKRLQTWIGHENIQLTIDVYGHLIVDEKKDAALAASAEAALLGSAATIHR